MSLARRKSLALWIDEALVDKEKDHRITAISLVHLLGQQRQEIFSVKIGTTGSYDGTTLEKVFRGKAEAYSQDLNTVQMFALLAFYGKQNEEAIQPFSVVPPLNPETAGLSTEAPTAEGRLQQSMRWADAQQMQVYRRQQTQDEFGIRMLEQQGRMLDRSQAMAERLMHENMETFTLIKDLIMQLSDNKHKQRMEQLQFERSTIEREKFMKFAPALVNTIIGAEIFPQSVADTALIETLAENVTPEMIEKLAGLGLPPELMGPLAARVSKAIQDKETHDAEKRKRLSAYNGSAEEDINGGIGKLVQ